MKEIEKKCGPHLIPYGRQPYKTQLIASYNLYNTHSNPNKNHKFWKSLWSTDVIPKMKVCGWKVINDIIPSRMNIQAKGIDVNPLCPICRKKKESTFHLMWDCKIQRRVWMDFIPKFLKAPFILCREEQNPKEVWSWMMNALDNEERAKGVIIMWCIWFFRNHITHSDTIPTAEFIYNLIDSKIKDWESTHQACHQPRRSRSLLSHGTWEKPQRNHWKMNSDAAWIEKEKRGGLGWIVRDSSGSTICLGMKEIRKEWPVKMLEAEAILEGLRNVIDTCICRGIYLEIESDALEVVNVLNGISEDLSDLKSITSAISAMASKLPGVSYRHCGRILNTVAHCVANLACKDFFWDVSDVRYLVDREEGSVFWAPEIPNRLLLPPFTEGSCYSVLHL